MCHFLESFGQSDFISDLSKKSKVFIVYVRRLFGWLRCEPLLKKKTQRAVTNMHFLLVSLSDWPFAVDEYSVTRQQDSCTRFAGAQRSWLSKLLDIQLT